VAKLAANETLRSNVQDRLSGVITAPDGRAVPGPDVRWIGRRHGRHWATSWSPEHIANRFRFDFPHDESMRISNEAIYQALYVQGRGALRRELVACLRTGRTLRVPRVPHSRARQEVRQPRSHDQRTARRSKGPSSSWTLGSRPDPRAGKLCDRDPGRADTRFTMLLHLPPMDGHGGPRTHNGPPLAGHGAEAVLDAIASTIITLPEQLRRSLTWDQGSKMSQHAQLRIDTGLAIYSCDPHSHGSEARTRTPMACCASTFRKAPT
jgi:hypothetical protein